MASTDPDLDHPDEGVGRELIRGIRTRVVVLEAGRVVEQGSHDDLVAAGGTYAGLWSAWHSDRPQGSSTA